VTLKFNAKVHRYWLDGKPVPGVTTLLKDGLPKPALIYWSARTVAEYVADNPDAIETLRDMGREPMVNALKGVPWEKRDKAAAKGTDIHALAERVVHGEDVEVPEELVDSVQGYADWLDRFDVRPVLTERSCANRKHWYAGRFDLIADIGPDRWLLDAKTGGAYPDAALQLDAYRNAEFYVDDDDPDTEHPMPEGITRLGIVHIGDGGTTLYPMQSDGYPFKVFQHVAWLAKQKKAVESFRLEPITEPSELEYLHV
jgi:hypothetical protein